MAQKFSKEAIARISATVKAHEAGERGTGFGPASSAPRPQALYFGIVSSAIATDSYGDISILADITNPTGDPVRTLNIFNWGCPLETGDRVVVGNVTGKWAPIAGARF